MTRLTIGQISSVAFHLFGWPVHWYGLIIGLGMVVAYVLIMSEAKRKQVSTESMSDIFFWTIIIGFIGARIYYVLFNLGFYLANPNRILNIWEGGIAIYGGVLAGIIVIWYLTKRYQLSFISVLDIAAPAVLLAQSIGRWGNFINQEAYGYAVERSFLESLKLPEWLINQMNIDGVFYHPTFLYESVWNLFGVILLLALRKQRGLLKQGEVAAGYLFWYGLGRMFIEGMRTDSLYLGPIRVSQWLAGLFVIISIVWVIYRRKNLLIKNYTDDRY